MAARCWRGGDVGKVQVISRAAPQAAAIVLSQMADRLLHARRSRGSAKTLRRAFSPVAPSGRKRPGTPQAGAGATDQTVTQRMGEIVTIAIVPGGAPPAQRSGPRGASAVRRCGLRLHCSGPMPPPLLPQACLPGTLLGMLVICLAHCHLCGLLLCCMLRGVCHRQSGRQCRLSGVLKQSLADSEGPCLALTWTTMKVLFPQVCHRLQVPFYRTKVTSWMASQEEDYRFILLEADPGEDRGWAQLCVEQACPYQPPWRHAAQTPVDGGRPHRLRSAQHAESAWWHSALPSRHRPAGQRLLARA